MRSAVINARVKRVLFKRACPGRDQVVADPVRRWFWKQGKHRRGLWRNPCVRNQITSERRPAGSRLSVAGQRVEDLAVYKTETGRRRRQILAKVTVAGFSKTTGAFHQSGRNRVLIGDPLNLMCPLIVAKEKQLVLNDG